MTADEIRTALEKHRMWINVEPRGQRANLAGADLADADLAGADLADADLAGADLAGANLAGANLARANLADANLADANLARANLTRADLADANLAGANLARANLTRANLAGACGNMREVKSAQFDKWPITWTCGPDGVVTLQIGCQRHPLDMWVKSDPLWISAMDGAAADWWGRYRDVVLALVQASPATPWGKQSEQEHGQ